MTKGIKNKSPTDPEENRKYHERRDKNNLSAKKHRERAKEQIAERQKFKELYEKLLEQQTATLMELQREKDENTYYRKLFNIGSCSCNAVPNASVNVNQATPAPVPLYNPYASNTFADTAQFDTRHYQSSTDSLDSGSESSESGRSTVSQDEYPSDGWAGSTVHYTDLSNAVPAVTSGFPQYYQRYQPPENGSGLAYPGMVNKGCPSSNISSDFPVQTEIAATSMVNAMQKASNEGENKRSDDFWTKNFPARKNSFPAQAKNSPLSELASKLSFELHGPSKSHIPVLSPDYVRKVLSPNMGNISLKE